jgi:hypothetical protein
VADQQNKSNKKLPKSCFLSLLRAPYPNMGLVLLDQKIPLIDPIYRRQPKEDDAEYALFLVYRDLSWDSRTLRSATAVAQGLKEQEVKQPHSAIILASAKWQWATRADAYDLFIQEYSSERQEKIVLRMKSDIEHICMRLVTKIKRLENISSAEELNDPEIRRDIKIIEALIGEGNAGKFALDAYRTIVGQKLQLGPMKKIPELDWKAA